jgi:hypothetical protein
VTGLSPESSRGERDIGWKGNGSQRESGLAH